MIKEYLLSRRKLFFLWLFPVILFPLIGYLWDTSLDAILYGDLLFTVLFLVILSADVFRYRQKRLLLQAVQNDVHASKHLTAAVSHGEEREYLKTIAMLYELLQKETESREQQRSEERQYYSLWVHQIKTPISAMSLALQNDTVNKALMEQEIFKVGQYVEMALNYAKLSNFSSDLVIGAYPLEAIVRGAVKKCATLFIHKNIAVSVEPMEKTVMTDEKWLTFVLEQLLTNAVKYSNQGSVSLSLTGDTLTIADSGIGIREQDAERIFEMGLTGYNGRLDKNASGIGLYLVKQVTEALSIEIVVTSKVGEGTGVALTFPKAPPITML